MSCSVWCSRKCRRRRSTRLLRFPGRTNPSVSMHQLVLQQQQQQHAAALLTCRIRGKRRVWHWSIFWNSTQSKPECLDSTPPHSTHSCVIPPCGDLTILWTNCLYCLLSFANVTTSGKFKPAQSLISSTHCLRCPPCRRVPGINPRVILFCKDGWRATWPKYRSFCDFIFPSSNLDWLTCLIVRYNGRRMGFSRENVAKVVGATSSDGFRVLRVCLAWQVWTERGRTWASSSSRIY